MPAVPENGTPERAVEIIYNEYGDPVEPAVLPEKVVEERRGQILLRQTILKSDHFPGNAC